MTKDEIIAMALKTGGYTTYYGKHMVEGIKFYNHDDLERFAKLVAEREREECAKVCDEYDGAWCAYRKGAAQCAASIRAKSEK